VWDSLITPPAGAPRSASLPRARLSMSRWARPRFANVRGALSSPSPLAVSSLPVPCGAISVHHSSFSVVRCLHSRAHGGTRWLPPSQVADTDCTHRRSSASVSPFSALRRSGLRGGSKPFRPRHQRTLHPRARPSMSRGGPPDDEGARDAKDHVLRGLVPVQPLRPPRDRERPISTSGCARPRLSL
jgi:hypothetical protein